MSVNATSFVPRLSVYAAPYVPSGAQFIEEQKHKHSALSVNAHEFVPNNPDVRIKCYALIFLYKEISTSLLKQDNLSGHQHCGHLFKSLNVY